MILIGCDPGESFGVAVFKITDEIKSITVFQGSIENARKVIITAAKCTEERVIIVVESFTVTPQSGRKAQSSQALAMLGEMRELARQLNAEFYTQLPAKSLCSNRLLKKLGFYIKAEQVNQSDANDANSAVRQAVLWLMKHKASIINYLLQDITLI